MALELKKTVKEILETMSTTEYLAWINYYNESPFGYHRMELREAMTCSILTAPYRKKDIDIKDFMLIKPYEKLPEQEVLTDKVKSIFFGLMGAQKQSKGGR